MEKAISIKERLSCVNNVFFIKLGKGSGFAEDCFKDDYLKLDYREIDHQLCLDEKWEEIHNYFVSKEGKTNQVATNHVNQIKKFYTAGEDTLWITFHSNELWWCFAKSDIILQKDYTKIRSTIGQWYNQSIEKNGQVFNISSLHGGLTKVQAFRGTICNVAESKYLIDKIKGVQSKEVVAVELAREKLKGGVVKLIKRLQPQDFEILVDLIFRNAGWQRIGEIGKNQKDIDIDLLNPITNQRMAVQVKGQSNKKEFNSYKKKFSQWDDYNSFVYVCHSSKDDFQVNEDENIEIYKENKLSDLVINSGLLDWLIMKAN